MRFIVAAAPLEVLAAGCGPMGLAMVVYVVDYDISTPNPFLRSGSDAETPILPLGICAVEKDAYYHASPGIQDQ